MNPKAKHAMNKSHLAPLDPDTLVALTRALEEMDDFVFLETCRPSESEYRSWLFRRPLCWLTCEPKSGAATFLEQAEDFRRQGYCLAGWLEYEFGYLLEPGLTACLWPGRDEPLARLGVFERPLVWDHRRSAFTEGKGWPRPQREGHEERFRVGRIRPGMEREAFLRGFDRIHALIESGDTYQVNYTFALDFSFSGSRAALYRRLRANQSVAYAAWIRCAGQDIMSFSPELFFRGDRQEFVVRPMKGTMGRGVTTAGDRERAAFLRRDSKSRSENVMIVDLLRNDLARLLERLGGGRVRVRSLFDVERYESLLQMTSTIAGHLHRPTRAPLADVFQALFPCGSVTGAPKIRTMEIIRELENRPRGVYCGAIGYCRGDELCFNVPIRTLRLAGESGSMGVGAGIVHDSRAGDEWEECLLKGRFLTHARREFRLIETLLWRPGEGYVLLEEHLDRLADSAGYFLFLLDREQVERKLTEEAGAFAGPTRVRLLLDRWGRLEISSSPLTGSPPACPRVTFSPHRTDPDDPFLYHKTSRRALYDEEYARARKVGLYEILFLNTRGEVTEGAISTIFADIDGRRYTPPLRSGLLPGTLRGSLLAAGLVRERVLLPEDLARAERLLVGNSVRGLVEVELVQEGR